ncbi:MAG: TM0106 family RecB-like putative nuclease [Candidatus Pacebacteria bacterium]|nr:TM0106 family RecB-like putative nuclease [Candidatus Paceibacterota bacterium]
MKYITASKLYDYLECPHRIWRDVYGPEEEKIKEVNPFVEMLWQKGIQHEDIIVSSLGNFLDLSDGSLEERFQKTIEAMKDKTPLIYQGVLIYENLRGAPDLLRLMPSGEYLPIDIKSGMGTEGIIDDEGNGKLKKKYAAQLALYVDVLRKLNFKSDFRGIILDIKGNEIEYELANKMGVRSDETFWDFYKRIKIEVQELLNNNIQNKPALSGKCKLCPWYNSCNKWVKENNDLTNIFYLGGSNRDRLSEDLGINNLEDFLKIDMEKTFKQKEIEKKNGNSKFLYNIGKSGLCKALERARIFFEIKKPVFCEKIEFPKTKYELFFDIETDPTQEFVYLHGVYERNGNDEGFKYFITEELSEDEEKKAWSDFWEYINSLPENDFTVYYYSPYEKTTYKALQKKYPDVISEEEVVKFFENQNVIDLYNDVILKKTDWPLGSYSIKAIAQYLGFKWRDETPSGALSIQWFNEYLKKKDKNILKRILEYNEDDCIATMVLKDGIEKLNLQ